MARSIFLLLVTFCSLTSQPALGYDLDPQAKTFLCSHTTQASHTYLNNVNSLLADFNDQSSISSFRNASSGADPDRVYGYYQCRGDVPLHACRTCINNGTEFAIKADCSFKEGEYFAEYCMLRYANYSMYGLWEDSKVALLSSLGDNVTNYNEYNQTVTTTMEALIEEAAGSSNFSFATTEPGASGDDQKVYSLVQCTPDIAGLNCSRCLTDAFSYIRNMTFSQGGFVVLPKCQMRYDNRSFLYSENSDSRGWHIRPGYYGLVHYVLLLFLLYTYLI